MTPSRPPQVRARARAHYNFAAAAPGETTLFGASSPGEPRGDFSAASIERYITFLRAEGISRIVCLLEPAELGAYTTPLLGTYRAAFGEGAVLHAPADDARGELRRREAVVAFVRAAEADGGLALVHCAMGMVRTADVLATWLVAARGYAPADAIIAVQSAGARRKPDASPRAMAVLHAMRSRL